MQDDGALLRTAGTHIEIGWATMLALPIVLVTCIPFTVTASHLLKGCSAVGHVREVDLGQIRHNPVNLVDHVLAVMGHYGTPAFVRRSEIRDDTPVPSR